MENLLLNMINIVMTACVYIYTIDYLKWVEYVKLYFHRKIYNEKVLFQSKPLKPLDCSNCMTFWTTAIGFTIMGMNPLHSIIWGFVGAVTTLIIKKNII